MIQKKFIILIYSEVVFFYLHSINYDNERSKAKWINIDEFKNGNKLLYPKEVFKYL